MSIAAAERPSLLPSLTGLRFFAAFGVVLCHVSRIYDPAAWAQSFVIFGYSGVSFFFMLSGFVLTWSHVPGSSVKQFYRRRFARVWPLHALTTLLAVPVAIVAGTSLLWSALPFVLTLTQAWVPGDTRFSFNGPSWSLSCEVFFYLMFPAIIVFFGKKTRPGAWAAAAFSALVVVGIAVGLVVMASMPERIGFFLYTMPLYRVGEFVIGICLALAMQRGWRPRFSLAQAGWFAGISYIIVAAWIGLRTVNPADMPNYVADLAMIPAFAAIIVAGAAGDIRGDRGFVRSSLAVKLGQWSFALYLIHDLLLRATEPFVDTLEGFPAVVATIMAIVASIALSGLLFEFFERPIEKRLRGSRRLAAHLEDVAAPRR